MHRLATIDLSAADISKFETYETTVLSLLARHGAKLEMRVRSLDGLSETHLLFFPGTQAFENYRDDPVRVAAQGLWKASGATSSVTEVRRLSTH